MTFSFVLDSFPDYTKFDQTHKVLAAIQVITEDVDSSTETREPCRMIEVAATDPNVRVVYNNLGHDPFIMVTAEGSNIDGRATDADGDPLYYDSAEFGNLTSDTNLTQIELQLLVDDDAAKNYIVTQQNPALVHFSGAGITGTSKTEELSGKVLSKGYKLVMGSEPGTVLVTVTDKDTSATVQTVQITNNIVFVKKSKITITGDDKVISFKVDDVEMKDSLSTLTTINGNSKVVITTSGTVEAAGIIGKVKKNNDVYTMTVNNNEKDVIIDII